MTDINAIPPEVRYRQDYTIHVKGVKSRTVKEQVV